MSADGLARVRPAMQAYIDDGRLAGVMTMVARQGQVVHWDAVGLLCSLLSVKKRNLQSLLMVFFYRIKGCWS